MTNDTKVNHSNISTAENNVSNNNLSDNSRGKPTNDENKSDSTSKGSLDYEQQFKERMKEKWRVYQVD
jgi:hypothetical protein